jgi:hypothetical protein
MLSKIARTIVKLSNPDDAMELSICGRLQMSQFTAGPQKAVPVNEKTIGHRPILRRNECQSAHLCVTGSFQ